MLKIGLIQVDGKLPNFALMKIARYHRANGDEVSWYDPFGLYDIVYKSKIFTYSPDYDQVIANAGSVVRGGTGYDLHAKLPDEVERCLPDYSMYRQWPSDTAIGFLTRGCVNRCRWCVVPQKEGGIRPVADIGDVTEGFRRKKAVLFDNNILAAGEYAERQLETIINKKTRVDFNQAMDARLVDEHTASMLAKVSWLNYPRFGCDTHSQITDCERAISLMRKHGYNGIFMLYTILQGDIRECEERLEYWRGRFGGKVKCHSQPFVNFNGRTPIPQWQKDMARWCNRHMYYAKSSFRDFEIRKGFKCENWFKN